LKTDAETMAKASQIDTRHSSHEIFCEGILSFGEVIAAITFYLFILSIIW